jgi:hypothetical protein
MFKNEKPSSADYTNAITSSHNEEAGALNVVTVNNLVPARFGKVMLEYVTSGYGTGQVEKAHYYSNGVYQESLVICNGDTLGSAHKTTISFINRNPASLAGKGFIIHDNGGRVLVWFNVDFSNAAPNIDGISRYIEVNLLSNHDHETIAKRTAQALTLDSSFIAIYSLYYVIISSNSEGSKSDSFDLDSGLYIKNTKGKDPTSLNNTYWFINSGNNDNSYYIWYNVSNSGTDPNISQKTGIMVSISAGASAESVTQATKIALDSTGKFITNINSDRLLIANKKLGNTMISSEQTTNFYIITQKLGEDRKLLATLIMEYDAQNNIVSVERL